MASVINFVDGTGSAALGSGYPSPADRFRNWTPDADEFGEGAEGLGDGKFYKFAFRTDYTVTFEIPGIPNTEMETVLRLIRHLKGGGVVEVVTGDANNAIYSNCCMVKGSPPTYELSDPPMLEYTLSLTLRNIDVTPAPFLCEYP